MPPHIPPHVFDAIVHKALASNIRKDIIRVLSKKPKYLSQIANEMKKKPQTVDFHLSMLQEIGLVESNWLEGKKFYQLRDKHILDFLDHKRPLPPKHHPKPPHEIVLDMWDDMKKRLSSIEKRLDKIEKKLK